MKWLWWHPPRIYDKQGEEVFFEQVMGQEISSWILDFFFCLMLFCPFLPTFSFCTDKLVQFLFIEDEISWVFPACFKNKYLVHIKDKNRIEDSKHKCRIQISSFNFGIANILSCVNKYLLLDSRGLQQYTTTRGLQSSVSPTISTL
jgi:hypothetical protein